MRALVITLLINTLVLTGCSLFNTTPIHTKAINANDLAVKHIYNAPKKNKSVNHFKRFHDPQLNRLISVALSDAPDIHIAKARVERAQQQAKIAYATLWPVADLSGYLQKNYFPLHGTVPAPFNEINVDKVNIASVALKFNYELDFWGKNREALASKISETYAAQMDLAETHLILSATIATAYFELQNTIHQQQLAKENARLLKQLSDIIVDRAKQGIESNIPVNSAISSLQAALLSVDDYKRAEMQSRHQLAVLMGKNPLNTQINTAAFIFDKKQLDLPEIIPANILAQRPDIASACALTEAAAHQINVAKSAFYPNINLKGLLSLQSLDFNKAFNIRFPNDSAGAAFDLPIFDAGARRANLGISYMQYELAVNQYNQTILNSLQQVSDQMTAVKTLNTQVTVQNEALKTAKSNYKLFRLRYSHGIIDNTQLIETKQTILQQKSILHNLQTRQKQAFVSLLAALGGEVSI